MIEDWWKPEPGDPFWLLEDADGAWLKNEHSCLVTRDAAKALRFPSRWHADVTLRRLHHPHCYAFTPTEHAWIDRDSDEHRNGEDAKRLSGEAMPARAGTASPKSPHHPPMSLDRKEGEL